MKKTRIKVECPQCKRTIERTPSRLKHCKRNYCSLQCKSQFESNESTIIKSCKVCGKEFKVRQSETRKFSTCSKNCQRISRKDSSNPNWRGGKTEERQKLMSQIEYKEWRESIYNRDNYTCQMCGTRGGPLEADHIKPWFLYPEFRYDLTNGRTLCRSCHRSLTKEIWRLRKCESFSI
jgi:5-methylcytosine-specific restriction endonuclease McrA